MNNSSMPASLVNAGQPSLSDKFFVFSLAFYGDSFFVGYK